MALTVKQVRRLAIQHTLFPPTSLAEAFTRMLFIQADPIRSPARAQDLILRHRVSDYHVGDLERNYPNLPIEEDFLYAYGFLLSDLSKFHYPRPKATLSSLEKNILQHMTISGAQHSKDIAALFGQTRIVNDWGGYSKATKVALERLHRQGHLRVSNREKGIRVYIHIPEWKQTLTPEERLTELVYATAKILSPITEKSLHQSLFNLRRHFGDTKKTIQALLDDGKLHSDLINGHKYLFTNTSAEDVDIPMSVRFLAPFDPLIWDRSRFEHFWGWQYRFEAYTPASKRVRGYYAMPILYGDEIVGWVNVKYVDKNIDVKVGYVQARPKDAAYKRAFDVEVMRMEDFLVQRSNAVR